MTRAESTDSGTTDLQFVGGGAIPTSALHIRQIPLQVAKQFIRQHHYLHHANPGHRVSFGIFASDEAVSRLIGVAILGRPVAANRLTNGESFLELYRLFILDCTQKNAESRVLGYIARWVKGHMPDVNGLIAYSDIEGQGHTGTIYKASGWHHDGNAGAMTWKTRADGSKRRDRGSLTQKIRWTKQLQR